MILNNCSIESDEWFVDLYHKEVILASKKSEKVEILNENALERCKAGAYVRIL